MPKVAKLVIAKELEDAFTSKIKWNQRKRWQGRKKPSMLEETVEELRNKDLEERMIEYDMVMREFWKTVRWNNKRELPTDNVYLYDCLDDEQDITSKPFIFWCVYCGEGYSEWRNHADKCPNYVAVPEDFVRATKEDYEKFKVGGINFKTHCENYNKGRSH